MSSLFDGTLGGCGCEGGDPFKIGGYDGGYYDSAEGGVDGGFERPSTLAILIVVCILIMWSLFLGALNTNGGVQHNLLIAGSSFAALLSLLTIGYMMR